MAPSKIIGASSVVCDQCSGFKSEANAAIILAGIEVMHMMRKRQARYAYNPSPSIAEQFTILAA